MNWKATTNFGVSVEKQRGIWFLSYEQMIDLVEDAPLHAYQNRIDDTKGNAKDSYILDLRKMDKKI